MHSRAQGLAKAQGTRVLRKPGTEAHTRTTPPFAIPNGQRLYSQTATVGLTVRTTARLMGRAFSGSAFIFDRTFFNSACASLAGLNSQMLSRQGLDRQMPTPPGAGSGYDRGVQDPGGTPRDFFPIKSRFGFHPGGQSPNRRFFLGASAGPCPPPGPKRRCFGWSPTLEDVDIAWSGSRFKAKITIRRSNNQF
jgi:hypothetical protein